MNTIEQGAGTLLRRAAPKPVPSSLPQHGPESPRCLSLFSHAGRTASSESNSEGDTRVRALTVTFQVLSAYKIEPWFEVYDEPCWAQTVTGNSFHSVVTH